MIDSDSTTSIAGCLLVASLQSNDIYYLGLVVNPLLILGLGLLYQDLPAGLAGLLYLGRRRICPH